MEDFWFNFWPNFVSDVAAGVLLGALVATWINKRQNSTERHERKKKVLTLLKRELEQNLRYLSRYPVRDNINDNANDLFKQTNFIANKLITENWRAFSDGGELQWINDVDILGQLASSYYAIQNVKATGKAFVKHHFYRTEVYMPVISEMLYGQLKVDMGFAENEIMASVKKIGKVLS